MTPGISRAALLTIVLLISAAGALAFHNAVHGSATNFDDIWQVTGNELVKSPPTLDHVTGILFAAYHGEYQPVKLLSYLADDVTYGAIGVNVLWGMHLTNVLFHVVNAILVALICIAVVRDLVPDGREGSMALAVGLMAGVYFVLHPAHVESVAWLSSRKDVLSFFFMALSFLVFRGFALGGGPWRAAACAVLFALALASKAVVLSFPLIALAWWWLAGWKGGFKVLAVLAALFALTGVDMAIGAHAAAAAGYSGAPVSGSYFLQFLTAIKTFPFYMRLLLFPVHMCAIYPLQAATGMTDPALWWGALMIAAQLAVVAFVPARPAKFIVLWYILALLPVLEFVPTAAVPSLAADRYVYVASVPFALAPALITWRVRGALTARGAVPVASALLAAAMLYAGVLGAATWSRNRVWRSSTALWRDVLATNPTSSIALVNLGQVYMDSGDLLEARKLFREAVRTNPGFLIAQNDIAETYEKTGDLVQAKAIYSQALVQPSTVTAYYTSVQCARAALGLARIYYGEGRYLTARRYAETANKLCPALEGVAGMRLKTDKAIADSRAVADDLLRMGDEAAKSDAEKAVRCYTHAAEAAIEYAAPHVSLARLYARYNRWDSALEQYSIAARLGASDAAFQYDFGVAALKNGDYTGGAECLSRALQTDPSMEKAKVKLAIARAYLGEPATALLLLKEVLDKDPSNSEARDNFNAIKAAVEKNVRKMTNAAK